MSSIREMKPSSKIQVVTNRNAPDLKAKQEVRSALESAGFTTEHLCHKAWQQAHEDGKFRILLTLWGDETEDVAQGVTVQLVKAASLPDGYVNLDFTYASWKVYETWMTRLSSDKGPVGVQALELCRQAEERADSDRFVDPRFTAEAVRDFADSLPTPFLRDTLRESDDLSLEVAIGQRWLKAQEASAEKHKGWVALSANQKLLLAMEEIEVHSFTQLEEVIVEEWIESQEQPDQDANLGGGVGE